MEEAIRIDKWLWAVRLFKTRSQATEACRTGKVKIQDQAVKPSRELKSGDLVVVSFNPLRKIVKVKGLTDKRVSAKLVMHYMEDLTPAEEIQKQKLIHEMNFEYRNRGIGRPTKRERREIELLKKHLGV